MKTPTIASGSTLGLTQGEADTLRAAIAENQSSREYEAIAADLLCRLCQQTPVRAPGDGCAACVEELLTVSSDLECELQECKRGMP